ncbi:MAG: hypothetical protein JNM50_07800 [Chromatiales bacterium]|jgi:hypothetical protein|nr:hypothetical protein [Chromatiales bacterium]
MRLTPATFAATLLLAAAPALAAPVQISYDDVPQIRLDSFNSVSLGGGGIVAADFGPYTFRSGSGILVSESTTVCGQPGDRCLIGIGGALVPRLFEDFSPEVGSLGFDLNVVVPGNVIRAVVTGVTGTSTFDLVASGLYAFADPVGLISVSLTNVTVSGQLGNFSFDDVKLGGPVGVVPVPPALGLLAGALGALALRRRTANGNPGAC